VVKECDRTDQSDLNNVWIRNREAEDGCFLLLLAGRVDQLVDVLADAEK
jgi:hypothetical protein